MSPGAPITPTRFETLQRLFSEALEQPGESRAAWAAQATDDAGLRQELLALLRAHERDDTLRSPVTPGALADVAAEDRWVGRRLGAWEVVRLVGTGGMGAVYEATRADGQYQQRAAVKFIHRFAADEQGRRRFRSERQILASLDHPNVARLLDGGVGDDGQPWLAMEYVDGQPITAWAGAHQLTVRERVTLMLQVCAAVQGAHQQLIVHRDLKPGNILVTQGGQVKLLDFGIARLLARDTDAEPVTQVGQRSFTPEYAAPEQVRGLPASTAADVYALGLVLYELVAGRRAFVFAGKNLAEIEHAICEEPPPHAPVDADLDAILQVALRKEPGRRYGSADLLARDLQHYLDGRPVTARPDSAAYRLGKLVRRRKLETAAIALAVVSIVAGLVATTQQARRAEAQGRRAEQVTSFLTTMLGAADPASLGKDVTVREVLDSAAVRADSLAGSPDLDAEVRLVVGNTYMALGEFEAGESQFARAVAARRRDSPGGSHALGLALARQAYALEYLGRFADADTLLQATAALYRRFPDHDPMGRAAFLDQQARVMVRLGANQQALPLLEEALAITLRHAPGNDSALSSSYANLGFVKSELGDAAAAESLYAIGVAAARRAFGNEHPDLAALLSPYAVVLEAAGKTAAADSVYREVLAMRRKLLGPEHPEYAWTMFNYADNLRLRGRYAESVAWARQVLALRGTSLPETHMAISTALGVLGRSLDRMDSLEAGGRALRESLRLRRAALPPGHWLIVSSESILGEHLALAGRYREAEAMLLRAEQELVKLRGEDASVVKDARARLVELYTRWGRPDDAARWQASIKARG